MSRRTPAPLELRPYSNLIAVPGVYVVYHGALVMLIEVALFGDGPRIKQNTSKEFVPVASMPDIEATFWYGPVPAPLPVAATPAE